MKKSNRIKVAIIIMLALAIVLPMSAFAAEDGVSSIAASDDVIMNFYEQNRKYAASLGIAVIDSGNTGFYHLGDIDSDSDCVFDWGSCTKVITWVCAMQLVEQGKLDLRADIRTYLPEGFLTRLKYDDPITMLHLMNHNAGFQDMVDVELFTEDPSKIPPLEQALIKNQPPQIRKPGETVAYSNFGAALAGYIVERVSGQDYGDYVISNIFSPLGMEHTAIKSDKSDNRWVENVWLTEKCYWISMEGEKYELGIGEFYRNPLVYGIFGPAGSACGTIEDFSKFVRALIPDENIKCPLFEKDSTLAEMFQPTLYFVDGTPRNAHGMWSELFGNGLFGHGGNSDGFSSNFMIDPVTKKAFAVMTNVFGEGTFTQKLLPVIFGEYDWGDGGFAVCEDISGKYNSMRGFIAHGFLKITGFQDYQPFEKGKQDNTYYTYGDEAFTLIQVSDRVYKMEYDDVDSYFHAAENGVLQTGHSEDLVRKSDGSYYAEWTLYNLCFASFIFAVAVLLTKGILFIVKKKRKQEICTAPREKYHLISLGCSAVMVLLLIISVILDIRFSILAVFGVVATILVVAAFVFGILQLKTNSARLRTRILRVFTLIASVALLGNAFYWEFYNFWSL